MKPRALVRVALQPRRVVVIGDTVVSEQGLAAIVSRDARYRVCGAAHTFREANEIIQHQRPDVILVEPFLENHDGIRWIKDLAAEFPRTRILIVSRQFERTYAERALHAGASGYWMKNSSAEELMHALEKVLAGEIYASPTITSLAMQRFVGRERNFPHNLDALTDREMAVFSLIAAGHGTGRIAQELGISRKTVETHCEHIKQKLNYRDAEALKLGACELLGAAQT